MPDFGHAPYFASRSSQKPVAITKPPLVTLMLVNNSAPVVNLDPLWDAGVQRNRRLRA
jgi:hypothetical protein